MKTFNTAIPKAPEHYTVPPLARWDMDEIRRLDRGERYFVLHAPRQTGKTSCLLALMEKLNTKRNIRPYGNLPEPRRHGEIWRRECGSS